MSGMHQPVSKQPVSVTDIAEPILHSIDFEDVALSRQGAKFILHGARAVLQQFMPGADSDGLTMAEAVALFVDKVFWEENSGGLIMCADVAERSLCLPIPKGHWRVRDAGGMVQ